MKQTCDVSIRIPEWVEPGQVNVQVTSSPTSTGKARQVSFEGRYARVGKVKAKQTVTMTFPIFERTDQVRIQGKDYTLIRKGNEVIHIDPPGTRCPLYQREKYRGREVQTKKVELFVADQQIVW